MPKEIKNPVEVKLEFTEENNTISLEVSAHYGVSCEYGDLGRRGMPIELTPSEEQAVKDMAIAVVLPQMMANEGIV